MNNYSPPPILCYFSAIILSYLTIWFSIVYGTKHSLHKPSFVFLSFVDDTKEVRVAVNGTTTKGDKDDKDKKEEKEEQKMVGMGELVRDRW